MKRVVVIDRSFDLARIFGVEDKNLRLLEKEFIVRISLEPRGIVIEGNKEKVEETVRFLKRITELNGEGFILNQEELKQYLDSQRKNPKSKESEVKISTAGKKIVLPQTEGQKEYIKSIRTHDIAFCIGPAGTGKTYLAMAMAVNFLNERRIRRIVLTRPAIEAGESLGFLPGTMQEKLGPYLRPLYDALYDMMDAEVIEENLETGAIEIAPLAYMRGRTLNNAFVVLDEAQNCTSEQLKMFLTRLGFDSKTVITGDITQSDLPGGKPLGLLDAVNILKEVKGIKFVNLTKKDVVRHPLVQKIIQAYEDFYDKNNL